MDHDQENPREKKQPWISWIAWLLAFSPALAPFWMIHKFAVDLHYGDEWMPDLAGLYIKAQTQSLSWADLAAQHSEHRLLVPRLLYLVLNHFTHWNTFVVLYLGWILICIASLAIWRLIVKTVPASSAILVWFLCNLLLFTLEQSENWLWCIGVANFLPSIFLALATLIAADAKTNRTKWILCFVLASAATFSNGNGFLFWPLIGFLLGWSDSGQEFRNKIGLLLAWCVGFVLNAAIFFHGYTFNTNTVTGHTRNLVKLSIYVVNFAGNPFTHLAIFHSSSTGPILGAAMLALFALAIIYFFAGWTRKKPDLCRRLAPWLTLSGYGILNGVMSSFFRAGFGNDAAAISRYVTPLIFLPLGLVGSMAIVFDDLSAKSKTWAAVIFKIIPLSLGACLIFLQICTFPSALDGGRVYEILRRQSKAALLLIDELPDNSRLLVVYNPLSRLYERANALNAMGYLNPPLIQTNNAAQILADHPAASAAQGQMEKAYTSKPGFVTMSGWAIFTWTAQPADAVFLTYQNQSDQPIIFAFADMGIPRQDIAEKFNNEQYLNSGWQFTIAPNLLPSNVRLARVTAWALDVDDASVTSLPGMVSFHR